MERKRVFAGLALVLVVIAALAFQGGKASQPSGSVVLYDSARIAVVEKNLTLELKSGLNEVPLEEVEGLDIAEVTLIPPEGVEVLGLVSRGDKKDAFEASVGQRVELKLKNGDVIAGTLMGYSDGKLVIEGESYYLVDPSEIAYLKVPSAGSDGRKSYAVVRAKEDGTYTFRIIYRVENIGWSSRYKLYLSDDAILQGYVVIDNPTNKSFEDVDVLLVSGDVTFYRSPRYYLDMAVKSAGMPEAAPVEPQKLEAFYLYSLGTADINAFERKLIPYVSVRAPVDRSYLYESYTYSGSGDVYEVVSLKTDRVLPAGIVEIYRENEGKALLIGEQWIDHTPKGDTLRLRLGRDVDLKGTTKVLDERHYDRGAYYKVEVTVENFGSESRDVVVRHYKGRGKLLESSVSPSEETASYVEFILTVGPGEKRSVTFDYEVSY
ncbi:DUF4139 domain-containing protein [Palaeococcus ferrophilus]|uniref:DUF4139 domain-containing protein n=1 Tax=Palaeococcus ferrophilus TaxID=83868 RepID=UPI00064EBDB2|nr:biotin--protein ligase [Palaeococcus ferrophilus]